MDDDDVTIDTLIAEMVEREVRRQLRQFDGRDVLVVYGPAVPGPMGPQGASCDTSRLDDLEQRIRRLEGGHTD